LNSRDIGHSDVRDRLCPNLTIASLGSLAMNRQNKRGNNIIICVTKGCIGNVTVDVKAVKALDGGGELCLIWMRSGVPLAP